MTELTLRNKNIISTLDYIKDGILKSNLLSDDDRFMRARTYSPKDALNNPEKYLQRNYLIKHLNDPDHIGHPVEYYSAPVSEMIKQDESLHAINKFTRGDFVTMMGANSDAVFLYYPPGGFVGWHTNQNNSGHQFIFSWSEKGDGYFQYYDKKNDEIIKLPDKAGWQCRHYHFGKEEPEHCWHSAYTNVPRITVCVLFRWWDKPHLKDQVFAMKDQLIEEIESEE